MGLLLFRMSLLKNETQHGHRISTLALSCFREVCIRRSWLLLLLNQAHWVLLIINLHVQISLSVIPLFLWVDCSLHPTHRVEASAPRVCRACLLHLLHRGLGNPLDVAAARVLASFLLIVVRTL